MNEMEKIPMQFILTFRTNKCDWGERPTSITFNSFFLLEPHMMIDELLHYCENIEAATLVRKQLELLARYKETENMDELKIAIKKKKVPQISKIENGRCDVWNVIGNSAFSKV